MLETGGVLLIPYTLWSLFYAAISIAQKLHNGGNINIEAYVVKYFTGGLATPLYYIVCLLQLVILTPLIIPVVKNRKSLLHKLLWLLTPIYVLFLDIMYLFFPDSAFMTDQGTLKAVLFPCWFLFYYLGMNVRYYPDLWKQRARKYGRSGNLITAIILEIIASEMIAFKTGNYDWATGQIRFCGFFYAVICCLFLVNKHYSYANKSANIFVRVLRHIGDCAYGIFYIHCFILIFIRKFCSAIGLSDIWILNFIICFLMTALLSVLAVNIVNVLAGKLRIEKALKWIGFERSI
ncbi:MAG: acyltransferase [Lachnospiraceae bacterium]|nr:acyltransferase [Lachnospiraceae bacterium]